MLSPMELRCRGVSQLQACPARLSSTPGQGHSPTATLLFMLSCSAPVDSGRPPVEGFDKKASQRWLPGGNLQEVALRGCLCQTRLNLHLGASTERLESHNGSHHHVQRGPECLIRQVKCCALCAPVSNGCFTLQSS